MPEMEARPPAENRHGEAPRGERPASWDAPRLTRADPSRLANATTDIVRLSALRPPLVGVDAKGKERTRAPQRAAGTNNTALFDIVNTATANGSLRAPRLRTRRARATLVSRASERQRAKTRDLGISRHNRWILKRLVGSPLGPGSRFACPGHDTPVRKALRVHPEQAPTRAWLASAPAVSSAAA